MKTCIFCKIISREVPGDILYETDEIISFLSLENRPLVIPKLHIENIYDLDSETGHYIIDAIPRLAKATKLGLMADGINLTQANDAPAGQEVFHIHFHLIPRWSNEKTRQQNPTRDEIVSRIKANL